MYLPFSGSKKSQGIFRWWPGGVRRSTRNGGIQPGKVPEWPGLFTLYTGLVTKMSSTIFSSPPPSPFPLPHQSSSLKFTAWCWRVYKPASEETKDKLHWRDPLEAKNLLETETPQQWKRWYIWVALENVFPRCCMQGFNSLHSDGIANENWTHRGKINWLYW